jgi:short-subunit dehydrogenase
MASEQHRAVLLTGASAGIGMETARLLAERGCEVWGASRNPARLPHLPRFHPVQMDLADHGSLTTAFAQAQREAAGFDVLINNAGSSVFGPAAATDDSLVREQFQILALAPMELIRMALPHMRQRQRATIINVTSLAARFPIPYMSAYNAAKAALSNYTRCLRHELAGTSIRVVDLQPGDINTGFHSATKVVTGPVGSQEQNRLNTAWEIQHRDMSNGPAPGRVAQAVWKIIAAANPPPVVVVGDFFQARVAPLAARLLPSRLLDWSLRRHYRL